MPVPIPQVLYLVVRSRRDPRSFNCRWMNDSLLAELRTHKRIAEHCSAAKAMNTRVRIHRLDDGWLPELICCECHVVSVRDDHFAYVVEFGGCMAVRLTPPVPRGRRKMYFVASMPTPDREHC
jgi:hypothetical protein